MPQTLRDRLAQQAWTALPMDVVIYLGALILGVTATKTEHGVIPSVWSNPVDVLFVFAFSLSLVAVNSAIGLYGSAARSSEGTVLRAAGAAALGTLIFYLAVRALTPPMPLRMEVPSPLLPYALLLGLFRPVLYAVHHSPVGQRRILIVGSGADAVAIQQRLQSERSTTERVVGILQAGSEAPGDTKGVALFDRDTNLWDLVSRLNVNEVIVAVREQRGGVLPLRELLECRIQGVRITDQTAFFERVHGEFPLESLKASWLIYGHGFEQNLRRRLAKRMTDIVVSLILLALALPVMVITALAIRLESPGPVIYRQVRVGRGGRGFEVLKFRSMRTDAERDGVAVWAGKGDARITRVGRFIRKVRIDELPQLFNVLRGQMSIVGPRPERPTFVDQLKRDLRFYDVRHSIKPGLTGWAQVRFNYAASLEDSRRKLQFDLFYVKNHTLALDLRILFETVRVVLRGEGAH